MRTLLIIVAVAVIAWLAYDYITARGAYDSCDVADSADRPCNY